MNHSQNWVKIAPILVQIFWDYTEFPSLTWYLEVAIPVTQWFRKICVYKDIHVYFTVLFFKTYAHIHVEEVLLGTFQVYKGETDKKKEIN